MFVALTLSIIFCSFCIDLISTSQVGKVESFSSSYIVTLYPCRLGTLASNVDFLPWQLRLTEMHSIASHRAVAPEQLFRVLRQYGRCEQRLGK